MRTIKGTARALHDQTTDYRPTVTGGGNINFDVPELRWKGDTTVYVKLLTVPDECTNGLFFEIRAHWLGMQVLCPGTVCATTPGMPCFENNRLYKVRERMDDSQQEEKKRLSSASYNIRPVVTHCYYMTDVSAGIEDGKQVGKHPKCWGDDEKRNSGADECIGCPWAKSCESPIMFFRFNFGKKGRSNGEKLITAWNQTADLIEEVFCVTPSGNVVKTRPIKIARTGTDVMDTNYVMAPMLAQFLLPKRVIDKISNVQVEMKDAVIKHLEIPNDKILALTKASLAQAGIGDDGSATTTTRPSFEFEPAGPDVGDGPDPVPFESSEPNEAGSKDGEERPWCFGDSEWFNKEQDPCKSCKVIDACAKVVK